MLDWLPENISTYGGDIDFFFYVIYYITTAVFFLVVGSMVYFLVRYRRREGQKAHYTHGHNTLELVWTAIPALLLIFSPVDRGGLQIRAGSPLVPSSRGSGSCSVS